MNKKTIYTEVPAIMTRKELQEILGISKGTAIQLLQENLIESFKIKGHYRITKEALYDFIENSMYAWKDKFDSMEIPLINCQPTVNTCMFAVEFHIPGVRNADIYTIDNTFTFQNLSRILFFPEEDKTPNHLWSKLRKKNEFYK